MAEPITIITEPTRKSRKFEDNVTVIRTFNPDPAREVAAIRHLLSWVAREVQMDESNKMPSVQSQVSRV
jgi:hypothetical protein